MIQRYGIATLFALVSTLCLSSAALASAEEAAYQRAVAAAENSFKELAMPEGADATYQQAAMMTLAGCFMGCFGDVSQVVPQEQCQEFCKCSTDAQMRSVSMAEFVMAGRETPVNVMQARMSAANECKAKYTK